MKKKKNFKTCPITRWQICNNILRTFINKNIITQYIEHQNVIDVLNASFEKVQHVSNIILN